jgi:hypothetical protein
LVGLLSRNNNSTRYAANLQTAETPDPVITLVYVRLAAIAAIALISVKIALLNGWLPV